MERIRLVEHLIQHYIDRDEFRVRARSQLIASGRESAVSFLDSQGNLHQPTVKETRRSLLASRHETLDYLHGKLHDYPVLDEDEHVHDDDDIFRFVIEEVDDRVLDPRTLLFET